MRSLRLLFPENLSEAVVCHGLVPLREGLEQPAHPGLAAHCPFQLWEVW